MITTLTPSPSLDTEYEIPLLQAGELHRASYFGMRAGGKGVNVARVLTRMGLEARAIVPLEPTSSEGFIASAERDSIELEFVEVEGPLRINTTLLHEGKTTKINAAAQPWSPKEAKRIAETFLSLAKKSEFAVIGGTLPPATPAGWITDLVAEASKRCRIVVDSSGVNLREAIAARPYLIKPNKEEAQELLGRSILDVVDAADAAHEMIALGAESVLLSLGNLGSIYAASSTTLLAKPAQLQVQSTVGAGDALLAGFIGTLDEGPEKALAAATAWAEATITNQNLHLDVAVHSSAISRIISEKRIVSLATEKGSKV